MRGILLVGSVFVSVLLTGCSDAPSVSSSYKQKLTSSDALPLPQTATPITQPAQTGTAASQDGAGTASAEPTGAGSAEAGAALLVPCKGCHKPGGLASSVTLNSAVIDRLDTAINGNPKAYHTAFADSFGAGRADLEAALDAIP